MVSNDQDQKLLPPPPGPFSAHRGRFAYPPLITTDGFQYYATVIGHLFGHA